MTVLLLRLLSGFKISSLTKLEDTTASDGSKRTLYHYLAGQCAEKVKLIFSSAKFIRTCEIKSLQHNMVLTFLHAICCVYIAVHQCLHCSTSVFSSSQPLHASFERPAATSSENVAEYALLKYETLYKTKQKYSMWEVADVSLDANSSL